MPMLFLLARNGICTVAEAMQLPMRVLIRLGEMLSERLQAEQEADARARARASARRRG